jgi:hypothetical protein
MSTGTFDAGALVRILSPDIDLSGFRPGRRISRRATAALRGLTIGLDCWIAGRSTQHRKPADRVGA